MHLIPNVIAAMIQVVPTAVDTMKLKMQSMHNMGCIFNFINIKNHIISNFINIIRDIITIYICIYVFSLYRSGFGAGLFTRHTAKV